MFLICDLTVSIVAHLDGLSGRPEYYVAEIFLRRAAKLLLTIVYRPPYCGYLLEFANSISMRITNILS